MPEQLDDMALIQRVLQGNSPAYAALVDRYQHYVFTLVLRYVPAREAAEELAQDVFVKAYRFLADFKGNSKFSTWLYTIVNSTCLSHLRKNQENVVLVDDDRMAAVSDGQNRAEAPSGRLEDKHRREMIERAMAHLPEGDRKILSLFYQGEQSIEDIGMILGLTASNVKVRLFRARQKMKEVLETKFSRELC